MGEGDESINKIRGKEQGGGNEERGERERRGLDIWE